MFIWKFSVFGGKIFSIFEEAWFRNGLAMELVKGRHGRRPFLKKDAKKSFVRIASPENVPRPFKWAEYTS